VIPTFIIDWPVLLLIGFLFGYGVKGMKTDSVFKTRAFVSGLVIIALFSALVYYSYLLAPDWMFNYFTRASDVPSWLIVYIFVLYFFAYAAGFMLKFELQKMGKGFVIVMGVVLLAASIAVPMALGDRYMMVGTLDQFYDGQAIPLPQSPVGKVPGTLTLVLIPLAIGLLIWSRRQKF
jgi:hypothetical protein